MTVTKNTHVKSSLGVKNHHKPSGVRRSIKTPAPIVRRGVEKILPRLRSYQKLLLFHQKAYDLFIPLNDAIVLAIQRDLGDAKESQISDEIIDKPKAQALCIRLLNKYLAPHKNETHSAQDLLDIAVDTITDAFPEKLKQAFRDLNPEEDDMILESPALSAMSKPSQWRHRFGRYYHLSKIDRSHVTFDENGNMFTKYAFECVFYAVFKCPALAFPVPERTNVTVIHEGLTIQTPCTIWSDRVSKSIVIDGGTIDLPAE